MNQILDGLDGVLCLIDDVLILWGKDQKEHDAHLEAALSRIQKCRDYTEQSQV